MILSSGDTTFFPKEIDEGERMIDQASTDKARSICLMTSPADSVMKIVR